ncbi:MAG: DUF6702 family protein [Gemmatimonadales bacterium]
MRTVSRAVVIAIATACTIPAEARAHPLHTTYTELSISRDGRSARALIRVFADDFTATVLKAYPAGRRSSRDFERAAFTYAAHRFRIISTRGTLYTLGWCGLRKEANFIWLCVGSDRLAPGDHLKLTNHLLDEVFNDQINVVRYSHRENVGHLLFAQGDGSKALR